MAFRKQDFQLIDYQNLSMEAASAGVCKILVHKLLIPLLNKEPQEK